MTKQIPKGYKQTKVGIIPDDWEVVKLGDICAFYKGKGVSKEDLSEEGTPCIRYGELYTTYNERIDNVISKTNVDINELFLSKFNDVIIPASGETAIDIATASCVLQDNVALSGDLNVIRTKENGIFLSYYLNVVAKHRIASIAQGVSVVHLYSSQLESLFLSLPPLKEQENIVGILSTWDEAIIKQEELIKQKQIFKKAMMQQIFSQKSRFKDDNGNDYPSWQSKKLGNICKFFSGGTPIRSNMQFYNGNIPFIGSGDINSHCVYQYINEEALQSSSAKLIDRGDLLMALYGATSGQVAISRISGAINQAILCIRTKQNKIFIYFWLLLIKNRILATYLQGGQGNLSAQIVKDLSLYLPCVNEQNKIADFLTSIDDEINKQEQILEQLKLQKQALMQKLLTGKVRALNFSKEIV